LASPLIRFSDIWNRIIIRRRSKSAQWDLQESRLIR